MESLFLPLLLLLLAVPLFLGSRRQKKAARQQQELQESLEEGDRVMTTSGMYATVVDISDDLTIDLEIADGLVTTWVRQAVREKVNPMDDEYDEDESDDDEAETAQTEDAVEYDETVRDDEDTKSAQAAPPLDHRAK
ncbi:MAG: preprotein translocase subunit YajC [Haloechinothrix sp.]